jgi:hypothetical protein
VSAPGRAELDPFDPAAVGASMGGVDAMLHLATRIQPLEKMGQPEAWRENDRLRAGASAILVDAALAAKVKAYIRPTVTFVYPDGQPASEETDIRQDIPVIIRSALAAEEQAARFAAAGRHGVVLRLGLLDGPGTGHDRPNPALGASLHTEDAARALLATLTVPSGIYNVCRDGERVSHRRFTEATGGVHCARSVSSRPRRPRPRAAGGARGARRRTVRYSRPRSRPAPTTRRPAATG